MRASVITISKTAAVTRNIRIDTNALAQAKLIYISFIFNWEIISPFLFFLHRVSQTIKLEVRTCFNLKDVPQKILEISHKQDSIVPHEFERVFHGDTHVQSLVFCISFENTSYIFVSYWKNNPVDPLPRCASARREPRMQMRSIDKCRRLTNTQHTLVRFRLNEICSAYVHKTPDLSLPTQRRNADYVLRMCTSRRIPISRNMRRDSTDVSVLQE